MGNLSIADTVDISGEKNDAFESAMYHVSGIKPNVTETFGIMP